MPESHIPFQLKQAVIERAHGCCEYCRSQAKFATQSFSVEHIIPRHNGGKDTPANLALSCQGCNNHKYTKIEDYDPVTGELTPLYHPRRQRWSEHFVWSEDYSLVIGITPTGRATIQALQLNREGVVNLRQALYAIGKHPPAESD